MTAPDLALLLEEKRREHAQAITERDVVLHNLVALMLRIAAIKRDAQWLESQIHPTKENP